MSPFTDRPSCMERSGCFHRVSDCQASCNDMRILRKGRRSYGDLLSGRRSYHSRQQDQSSDEPDTRLISGSGIRPPDQPESGPLSGFYSSVSKIQGSSSVPEPPVIVIFVRSSCTPGRMPFCTSPWPPQLICPFPPMIPVHLTFGRIFVVQ